MPNAKAGTAARKPSHKMIEVKLRFWTDSIADKPGGIVQKRAWDKGYATVSANELHGINKCSKEVKFNSILEIHSAVAGALEDAGVTLYTGHKLRKLIKSPPKQTARTTD